MPPPLNITGQKLGSLLVIRKASNAPRGGEWLCRCDCGREEIFPARRLPYTEGNLKRSDVAKACSVCTHTRVCKVCGKNFFSRTVRACCSDECRNKLTRKIQLKHYHEVKKVKFPDLHTLKRQKIKADPTKLEKLKAYEKARAKKRWVKIKTDEVLHSKENKKSREWYAANAERVNEERRRYFIAMTPEEYLAHRTKAKRYYEYYINKMKETDPEKYKEFIRKKKENCREYKRRMALSKLTALSNTLLKRSKK